MPRAERHYQHTLRSIAMMPVKLTSGLNPRMDARENHRIATSQSRKSMHSAQKISLMGH